MKQKDEKSSQPIRPINLPKNSPLGLVIAIFAFMVGFGVVWHIVWLALVGFIGVIVSVIVRISSDETEHIISADTIRKTEAKV